MLNTTDSFGKKVLKGLEVSEFSELGFKKNPFLPYIPKDNEAIKFFINRSDEIGLLIRYLPELINGFIPILVLNGSKGIGKTHFLVYIYNELKYIEEDIGHEIRMINKDNFKEFYDQYKVGKITKKQLLLTDDTERIWEKFKEEFVEMIDSNNQIKFISAWKSSAWNQIKQDNFYSSLKPSCIKIRKLSKIHLIKIVSERIKDCLIDNQNPFEGESLNIMAKFSEGVPYSMVYFCEQLLHFSLNKNKKKIDSEITNKFINELNLKKFDMTSLSPSQLKVLRILLNINNSKNRGSTSSEVAEELEIGRTGALSHLKDLVRKRILDEKLENKKRFYYISPSHIEKIESYFVGED